MDNSRRFLILRDKVCSLSVAGSNREINIDEFVRCRLVVQYGTNGGTIADI